MKTFDLFKTPIFTDVIHGLDRDRLETKIRKFAKEKESNQISNVGGFQGDDFRDETLCDELEKVLPLVESRPYYLSRTKLICVREYNLLFAKNTKQ